jgi:hypothetical protein
MNIRTQLSGRIEAASAGSLSVLAGRGGVPTEGEWSRGWQLAPSLANEMFLN